MIAEIRSADARLFERVSKTKYEKCVKRYDQCKKLVVDLDKQLHATDDALSIEKNRCRSEKKVEHRKGFKKGFLWGALVEASVMSVVFIIVLL
jgi:hypothetical protein